MFSMLTKCASSGLTLSGKVTKPAEFSLSVFLFLIKPQDLYDDDEDFQGKLKKSRKKLVRTTSLTQVWTNQS